MSLDQVINLLVTVTLIEMMMAIGLGVTGRELLDVGRNWQLVVGSMTANFVCVPVATVVLLLLFRSAPMVSVGFLILAVCPGAPFGPPLVAIAGGSVSTAVGLMAILAATSAVAAPLLLGLLLPWIAGGESPHVDSTKLIQTLLVTQLIPLSVGLGVRHWRPVLADRLRNPANTAGKVLNLLSVGAILATQYPMLATIRPRGIAGMTILLLASLTIGWLMGGPSDERRRSLALTTSLRNMGVSLVIATAAFGGTPAVTAVLAYGLFGILGSLLLALWWGQHPILPEPNSEIPGSHQVSVTGTSTLEPLTVSGITNGPTQVWI